MTANREDYLKQILKLGGDKKTVSNKEIAESLGLSPASVSEMLSKLKKEGLIEYEAYKGIRLSAAGAEYSILLTRNHRLWEVFLIEKLGYGWSDAHEDAELLEHVTPKRLSERLAVFLGNPTHCPHGSVIPQYGDTDISYEEGLLSDLKTGDEGKISRVVEEKELMNYLEGLGVKIGADFTVLDVGDYEGGYTLRMDNTEITISRRAAQKIYITV